MVRWAGPALLFCLAPFVQTASAQSFPDRPIRVISPNPAAGSGLCGQCRVATFVALGGIQHDTGHGPLRGGGRAMTGSIAGDTQCCFSPIAGMVPVVAAGSARPLAVSGDGRAPAVPEVPT